jgi:hypothetical protein
MDDDINYGIPCIDCALEGGGFFLGVDDTQIAHVIVPALTEDYKNIGLGWRKEEDDIG